MKESVRVLLTEEEVDRKIDELGAQITRDYAGRKLHLVCVLKGGAPFMCELAKRINLPQAAGGIPFNACEFQVKGDPITDLMEDLAAEQKARSVYDNLLRLISEPDIVEPLRFLRAREIVHFQRFGEALNITREGLDAKNFYAFNPSIDT